MPVLTKKTVTVNNQNGDSFTHEEGTVLSDWEISTHVAGLIEKGDSHTRTLFEPLTDREAQMHRVKATSLEGPRVVEQDVVDPPFDDYVGLHPGEIIERMHDVDRAKADQIKKYERGGLNRRQIIEYVAPSEKEPWKGYSDMGVRDILSKFSVLSDADVQDAIVWEMHSMRRPAVIEYDRAIYESEDNDSEPETVGAAD